MDRNIDDIKGLGSIDVVTREGGLDRNFAPHFSAKKNTLVATREGGVDRNILEFSSRAALQSRHPRGWRG